jgi:hypothetical protein
VQRRDAVLTVENVQVDRLTLDALGDRRALPQFRTDGDTPHVDVGGSKVLPQPVALTGEKGNPARLAEMVGSSNGIAVSGCEVGTHEVQQPERLGAEGVAVASSKPSPVPSEINSRS